MIRLKNGSLYQWDINRIAEIYDPENKIVQVHCCRKDDEEALVLPFTRKGDNIEIIIPNIFLQSAEKSIYIYAVYKENDEVKTADFKEFLVVSKERPTDYIYEETEVMTYLTLEEELKKISEKKADLDESGKLKADQLPDTLIDDAMLSHAIDTALSQALMNGQFKGEKGDKGEDGYTPVKGVDYFDGAKGEKGDKGDKGADGYTPVKGVDFFDGTKGEKGDKGDKGADGYTPVKGVDYFDGAKGEKGDKGDKGEDGYTPVKGVDYFDGAKGEKGDKGDKGEDGYTPVKGVDYFDGAKGEKGDKGDKGEDGYTPVKGVDYFDGAKGEKGDKGDTGTTQITPLFAESVAECTDTSKVYVLPDGYIYGYITKVKDPTNRLKNAIDKDGSLYNGGQGWKTGYYLPSTAGDDLVSGAYEVTGFIPYKYTDTFRAKNLTLEANHSYNKINFYDAGFNFIKTFVMNSNANPMTQFVKSDGTVEGRIADSITSNITDAQKKSIAYFRISCININSSTLITVNEPLEPSEVTAWQNTGHAFVPADYEDRIIDLEEKVNEKANTGIVSLNSCTCSIFKKVVCCGDSFTAGYINIGNGVQEVNEDYAWPSFMARLTGNEYINCGASGASVLSWQTTARGLPKAKAAGVTQAYLVGLGINDASNVTLGTSDDIGTENQTYYGGMSKIVRELNAISPKAKIFLQTMPTNSETRQAYNDAIRTIVEIYKNTYPVYLLDLDNYKSLYFIPSIINDSRDGHYTAIAYQQFAENLRYIWSEYINSHISEFQDVYSLAYSTSN